MTALTLGDKDPLLTRFEILEPQHQGSVAAPHIAIGEEIARLEGIV